MSLQLYFHVNKYEYNLNTEHLLLTWSSILEQTKIKLSYETTQLITKIDITFKVRESEEKRRSHFTENFRGETLLFDKVDRTLFVKYQIHDKFHSVEFRTNIELFNVNGSYWI